MLDVEVVRRKSRTTCLATLSMHQLDPASESPLRVTESHPADEEHDADAVAREPATTIAVAEQRGRGDLYHVCAV